MLITEVAVSAILSLDCGEFQGLCLFVGAGGGVRISRREKGHCGCKCGSHFWNRRCEDINELEGILTRKGKLRSHNISVFVFEKFV